MSQGARLSDFHTKCILLPCCNGWNLGAGVLDCRSPPLAAKFIHDSAVGAQDDLNTGVLCSSDVNVNACGLSRAVGGGQRQSACGARMGSCAQASDQVFAGACYMAECALEVVETIRRASVANLELPLQTDPIRWANEWRLPFGNVAPNCLPFLTALRPPAFEVLSLHEQSAAFRHAWGAAGFTAASVADRPTTLLPTPGAAHFISEVRVFHEWYRHPIPFVTTHWDCAPSAYVSSAQWKAFMRSGELLENIEHAMWCRSKWSISRLYAGETTKGAMEVFLGSPLVKTNLALWSGDRLKDWWWFSAIGVPVLVAPQHPP